MALIFLVLAGLVVGPFLSYETTTLLATQVTDRLVDEQYAADAGVEDAIWKLLYTDITDTTLIDEGDFTSYLFSGDSGDSVNGLDTDVLITKVAAYLARDNFESNSLTGGIGWVGDWQVTGGADVTTNYLPNEGSFHLQLKSGDESAKRAIDLSGKSSIHLQFYAKVNAFEPGDTAVVQVSSNNIDWTPVEQWEDGEDDNIYHFYDIDLSSYAPYSSEFWIMLDANMDQVSDWIFFDEVVIKFVAPGAITPPSDDFESGGFTGGVGWLDDWAPTGDASIDGGVNPYEGSNCLRLRNAGSYIERSADLSGQSGLSLQLWARVRSFDAPDNDEAYCKVSSDGTDWTTVKTWTSADSDNTYHFYDIDLASYAPYSSTFWIAFDSGMNKSNDYFYVDNLQIAGAGAGAGADAEYYDVVSISESIMIEATVTIDGGASGIISWQMS